MLDFVSSPHTTGANNKLIFVFPTYIFCFHRPILFGFVLFCLSRRPSICWLLCVLTHSSPLQPIHYPLAIFLDFIPPFHFARSRSIVAPLVLYHNFFFFPFNLSVFCRSLFFFRTTFVLSSFFSLVLLSLSLQYMQGSHRVGCKRDREREGG